jgi:ribulose-5-phosphate 4-epimerase/fuculose-1-phosphate aldolase
VNIHAQASTSTSMSADEWQARVDLAAAYRLVANHGWDDVIYNHAV